MLGLRRSGLVTGSRLRVAKSVSSGVGTAGEELNSADDRSLEVAETGEGLLLGVSRTEPSDPWRLLDIVLVTSSVELVGD